MPRKCPSPFDARDNTGFFPIMHLIEGYNQGYHDRATLSIKSAAY